MQLQDKVAVITGGTAGLGRGIAEAFLREGARVVLNGRSQGKGDKVLADLGAGDRAVFRQGDVLVQADIESLVDFAVAHFGCLDIMVNNAGGTGDTQPVARMTDEEWALNMRWNLDSTFFGTRRALQHMLPRKSGRIINMSSVEGKRGKAVMSGYVTAKHAVNGFTKSVAKEVGTEGITVNALCPGPSSPTSSATTDRARRPRWASRSTRWLTCSSRTPLSSDPTRSRRSLPWPCWWPLMPAPALLAPCCPSTAAPPNTDSSVAAGQSCETMRCDTVWTAARRALGDRWLSGPPSSRIGWMA